MGREVFVLLTFSFGDLGLCCKAADPGTQAHPHLCFSATSGPSSSHPWEWPDSEPARLQALHSFLLALCLSFPLLSGPLALSCSSV